MKRKLLILCCLTFLVVTGCMTDKAQMGAVLGTLGGAAVGGQVGKSKDRRRNAIIGALAGGVIGYIFGNEMDKADRTKLSQTFENTPSNKTVTWVNPDTQNTFTVTPEPAYYQGNRPCRDAYIKAVINGEVKQIKTTACRNNAGIWEIIK